MAALPFWVPPFLANVHAQSVGACLAWWCLLLDHAALLWAATQTDFETGIHQLRRWHVARVSGRTCVLQGTGQGRRSEL